MEVLSPLKLSMKKGSASRIFIISWWGLVLGVMLTKEFLKFCFKIGSILRRSLICDPSVSWKGKTREAILFTGGEGGGGAGGDGEGVGGGEDGTAGGIAESQFHNGVGDFFVISEFTGGF